MTFNDKAENNLSMNKLTIAGFRVGKTIMYVRCITVDIWGEVINKLG
jgi:hypothetical protein